ncbi:hypothetical protein F5Y09DRAFT_291785 [Xylaria sp. FL1042]|nr:hypothetical protein F5Y09DRAFT_291785 [Xylaria sp. FL1042]
MFFRLPWAWRCFFASYHLIILPCHPIYKSVGLALSDHSVSVSHHHHKDSFRSNHLTLSIHSFRGTPPRRSSSLEHSLRN